MRRYVRVTEETCFFYGCVTKKKSFCQSLMNTNDFPIDILETGQYHFASYPYTVVAPSHPALSVQFHTPPSGTVKPQGLVNESTDPTDQKNSSWRNWNTVKTHHRARQKTRKFRFTLSVVPPRTFSCDDEV